MDKKGAKPMRRSAFTLIELLISVAIISLLVAVLLPALAGAKRHAMRVTCQSNLRQISTALWAYSVANDSRIPYIESPLTNGGSVPGYGNAAYADNQVDPFDRELWPRSVQNVLMPLYLGSERRVFSCAAATRGWPRGGPIQVSYRDSGANQPNGMESPEGSYFRENFGFMDGRPMVELRIRLTGDPIADAQMMGRSRSTYMRDMIVRQGNRVVGPHGGGINVISREFGVEWRDAKSTEEDLGAFGAGVQF